MKKIVLLAACSIVFSAANAQTVHTFSMSGNDRELSRIDADAMPEQKEIAAATLECYYDYEYLKDTDDPQGGKKGELMVLQIGDGLSRFFSYRTLQVDSLLATVSSPQEMLADISKFKKGETFNVYKNYPTGKITYTDNISRTSYLYEEGNHLQEWEIGDEIKSIEGYECRIATCTFRGRNYTAWFTPEIPVGEGPWKFSGLPGLIMEVYDDEGHYRFVLTGLRSLEGAPIYFPDLNYHKTNRKDFLKTMERFEVDPIGFMSVNSNVQVKVMNPDGTPRTEAMEPKPLKYEYLERDYK